MTTLHSTNRLFEWAISVIMLQMGLGVFAALWLDIKIIGAFNVLIAMHLGMPAIALIFSLLGFLRCLALYANGKWKYGCYVRAVGCAVGVFIWSQMFCGVLIVLLITHQMYMVIFVWSTFAAFEFFSLMRSILDLKSYGNKRVSGNATRIA